MTDKHTHSDPDSTPVRDCDSAMSKLFDLLDGECTAEKERQLRLHITSCPDCFTQADFEKRFLDALSSMKKDDGCPDSVRNRVIEKLRAAGFTDAAKA
jgi:anti-sigma factor (TIGR02949 family)